MGPPHGRPDFWSEILFGPVRGPEFAGPVRGPEFGPKIRSGADNPDRSGFWSGFQK